MKRKVYKLPAAFLEKLKKIYPSQYVSIVNSFSNKKEPTFRVNYLKTDLNSLRNILRDQRVRFRELNIPKGAFLLRMPLREFQRKEVYQKGLVYVQNLSSMLVPLVLEPANGERILDLCAAPGAKTTQIVSLAPEAEIIAIDKIRNRYYKLLANLENQGVKSAKVLLLDSIWVRKKFPDYFDKILADVPCSAEGRFWLTNPKSFKYWKERKVKEMVHKQKKLLHSAFFALKEGGILVYSTCTFSPEENEGVINWFLSKFKEAVELVPINIGLNNVTPGFTGFKDKKFSQDLRLARRVIPNDLMEGFFIAKIRKISG